MGIQLRGILHGKSIIRRSIFRGGGGTSKIADVPKGYLPVYVGEAQKKRFLVPVSYLNQHLFQDLLNKAEEEFGYSHPMGGLTLPCREDDFLELTSRLIEL
ncbi:hypothetical protein NMG60_11014722 [Bertholletia excelsa]